ncbi:ectonucleoside triphosphate diphosphohydrolase 1-like [Physella acuta]|uniref:ectonucleoside triphosphate diphosphohydrolase 1-like n=1 Tax=Physella acuta TaxID=109671 RepID=UPI0027DEA75A|nr:ectonucleoside triphosphate diphosphohydrolase 1-like [Physella acuta]
MEEIEITVQSILPSDEPQGRFRLRISPNATVEELLRELCREANSPLKPEYCLRSKGHDLLQRTDILSHIGVQDGAFLHWTSENVEVATPCRCNTFWFLALVSFIIGTVGIVALCVIRFKDSEPITDYAIVFDAGSTHTAMFIYKWEGSKLNGTAVAVQSGEKCAADGAGIANFANNPDEAGKSLERCISQAKVAVPANKHVDTPIYLGATAGMRLLNLSNPKASEAILESVRKVFTSSSFKFTSPGTSARIISGSEEGLFSWITSNYVANAFKVQRPGIKDLLSLTIVPTIGALDLGGASTQITFVPDSNASMPSEYNTSLRLFGHNYTVYTHSYLCYGVMEVTNQILAALVKGKATNATEIEHPCLPTGYNVTMSYNEIFGSPCTKSAATRLPFYDTVQNFTFMGRSNVQACESILNTTLFNTSFCPYSDCSFNEVYQPKISGPFYAFSSYFYVSSFLNLTTSNSSSFEHSRFVSAKDKICNSTWDELLKLNVTKQELQNLMWYCLQSSYINLLLYDGFKFSDSDWLGINFVEKVSATEVGWTLGFVLNESNLYPADYPEVTIYTITFALLMVLFCLFLLVSVGLIIQGKRVQGSNVVKYRRMSTYGAI